MDPLTSLAAASIALVGTHFALSHPLRAPLVAALRPGGFLLLYSLVALACLWWMVVAFRAAPEFDLPGSGEIGWVVATLLTLPALLLFIGSLMGNPAFPNPGAAKPVARAPNGVFAVTRHPMMWGFALWALAHLALFWSWRTTIVALAVLVLALVGARLQDRKKERLLGDGWRNWESQTSYWPRWSRLFSVNPVLWLVAIVAWLGVTWVHIHAAGVPAGLWRWIG